MNGFEPPGHGLGPGSGDSEFDADELSRRLHDAVSGISPAEDSLIRIQHAVPVRRRRRSAITVGTSAVVLLVGGAVAAQGAPGWVASVTHSAQRTATISGGNVPGSGGNGSDSAGASEHQGRAGGGVPAGGPSNSPSVNPTASHGSPGPKPTISPTPGEPPLPNCDAADLAKPTMATDSGSSGTMYGYVDVAVVNACQLPVAATLTVTSSQSGAPTVATVPDSEAHFQGLPNVSSSGTTIALAAGSTLEFQFAWSPGVCQAPSGAPSASKADASVSTGNSGTTPTPTPTPSGSATSYQVGYTAVTGGQQASVTLSAACGATLYVTDIYHSGQYPLAQGSGQPSS